MSTRQLETFAAESNRIEGIHRPPFAEEITALRLLLESDLTIGDVTAYVRAITNQPLRSKPGMDVRVGDRIPPAGGPFIEPSLTDILGMIHMSSLTPYQAHQRYERLHPYIGQDPFRLPFLHAWYYQSLSAR